MREILADGLDWEKRFKVERLRTIAALSREMLTSPGEENLLRVWVEKYRKQAESGNKEKNSFLF